MGSLKHSLLLLARTRRFSRGTSVSLVRHSIPCNIQAIEVHHVTNAFDPVSDPSAVPMHPDKTGCRIRVDYSVHAFEMPVCVCVCEILVALPPMESPSVIQPGRPAVTGLGVILLACAHGGH